MTRKEVININKKLIFPVVALALLGLAVLDVNFASADNSTNPRDTLVQKIAEKFNLNQNEVQQVFDEVRDEHQAEMQANFEEKLTQAVSDGKITKEQKALVLNKHEELQADREQNRDQWQNLTQDERRAQMEERRTDLESWAEENGIDLEYFFQGHGPKGHGGFGPRN